MALLSAVCGYLAGSIPFALVIMKLFGHGKKLEPTTLQVPGSSDVITSDAVSATAVRLQLGAPQGCLTSILDMAKASAITLLFKYQYPHEFYFLITSGMAVVGHIWPVFNRFRGGRGQSPIIGGFLVVDWPVAFIAYPLAQVIGLITRSRALVSRFGAMFIAAGWLYYRFESISYVAYALGLFVLRIIAMRSEVKQYARFQRQGKLKTLQEQAELLHLGDGFLHAAKRLRDRIRRSDHRQ